MRFVAVALTLGLVGTGGAGIVLASQSVGGGSQTFSDTSFRHMDDASYCEYHGPFSESHTFHFRHGTVTVIFVWDCRHLHIHFGYGGDPYSWRIGGGSWNDHRYGSDNTEAPAGTNAITVSADGSSYTLPLSW